jgi:hypothetical protein
MKKPGRFTSSGCNTSPTLAEGFSGLADEENRFLDGSSRFAADQTET